MTPVNFALVGTGAVAQSYAAAFDNNPAARLVAVSDVRLEAAQAFAARFGGVPAVQNPHDLFDPGLGVEAAVICTPPNTHEELTVGFAGRGVHVLCEKPFALTSDSARRMAAAAETAGVVLTMGSKFRYTSDVLRAKELVADGLVGEVVLLEAAFTGRVGTGHRWDSTPAVSGGGVLIDTGTHAVDLVRYFLGPLAEVQAAEGKRPRGLPVEDTARLSVRAACGITASVDLSWSINKELDWYVTIYGTGGVVRVGWTVSRYKRQGEEWTVFGHGYDKVHAFRAQVANFAGAARGHEALLITWQDAVASVEVIEAAYRSLNASPWTGVPGGGPLAVTPAPIAPDREVSRV